MNILLNILLFFIAVLLLILITPIALFAKILIALFRLKFDFSWFRRLAISLDQFGNVIADDFFNLLLIDKHATSFFGNEDETISSVLGKNYLSKNLTFFGRLLRKLLHRLDPNHSVKSIEHNKNKK